MKSIFFSTILLLSHFAFARDVFTKIDCVTSNGKFMGSHHYLENKSHFSSDELKDILLQSKQVETADTPYPDDIVVGPRIENLQKLNIQISNSVYEFSYALFFSLLSRNFIDMHAFCTVSKSSGACPPGDKNCIDDNK